MVMFKTQYVVNYDTVVYVNYATLFPLTPLPIEGWVWVEGAGLGIGYEQPASSSTYP